MWLIICLPYFLICAPTILWINGVSTVATRFDLVSVRALVVHAVVDDWNDPENIARSLTHATTLVKKAARFLEERLDIKPNTLRVTLPPTPLDSGSAAKVLGEAIHKADLDEDVYYGLLRIDASLASPESVVDVLRLGARIFASIATPVTSESAVKVLYEVAKADPLMAARFAVSIPGFVESPYFPAGASLSSVTGLSASLLYPRLLENRSSIYAGFDDLDDVAIELEDVLSNIAEGLGIEYRGLDLSLSPWMEESVARILEEYSGKRIYELGVAPLIMEIEELIDDICSDLDCIGFNQVMLPVAEDNLLKQRVAEGKLTLYKLAHLMYTCISGLDMIVVSEKDWTPELAKALIQETVAAASIKGKPLGIRVIVADAEPGAWIDLGYFEHTPVIRVDS